MTLRRRSIPTAEPWCIPWCPTAVENSVLFRGCTIKKGAVVEDSVILPGVIIGEDVCIRCAVVDKKVKAIRKKELIGEPDHPLYIKRGDRI